MAALAVEPWRPTLEEYAQLASSGAFEGIRVELLDGVITPMSPIDEEHHWAVGFLTRAVLESVPREYVLFPQSSLWLGEGSVPEPDFTLVGPARQTRRVRSADWVCEVAVSSVRRDRGIKRVTYARHLLPEYWIVLPLERRVEVHLEPYRGDYRDVRVHTTGVLRAATLPGPAVDLDALWAAEPAA